ncbi:rhamnosyltransferase I subunit B [Gluconacetobacter johannae DSM 13595]|uniref:Erythromycin biosynthesis protein CIII-like C-terminal domain-containing protein n=1 Tax=Gluconacetobacter johannae TaxID=112140 RepID=A0A7W4P247_9PROT|nr:nucleotide disphospho-sugar-binding domain-containing protein [Gluconacetobacter johannae]MBB2174419.1 hypothetical protein [Gluconacetobacter johannae]GBQ84931.1 rhamnosyltransferase I subunit B [Gluconacetobacter johannae DSM 13595]
MGRKRAKAVRQSYHFVVLPIGTLGDFLPAAGLARELAARGHDVDLMAQAAFASHAPGGGVRFRTFGRQDEYERDIANVRVLDRQQPVLYESLIAPTILPHRQAVETAVRTGMKPVVVLSAVHAVGALWAARCLGAQAIGMVTTPPYMVGYQTPNPVADSVMRAAFRGCGLPDLPPPVHDGARLFWGDFIMTYDAFLELFPAWLETVPMRRDARHIQGTFPGGSSDTAVPEIEAFALDGPAPWIFFPGSSGMLNVVCRDFRSVVAEYARLSGRRCILIDRTLDVPFQSMADNLVATPCTDMNRLLPLARGVLHHGGIGIMSQSLAAGLPQVVVPVGFDQPANAQWLEDRGVAVTTMPAALSASHLLDLVAEAEALAPGPARDLARRLKREGGTGGLAEMLLDRLDGHVPASGLVRSVA